jgi:hypothetical protein
MFIYSFNLFWTPNEQFQPLSRIIYNNSIECQNKNKLSFSLRLLLPNRIGSIAQALFNYLKDTNKRQVQRKGQKKREMFFSFFKKIKSWTKFEIVCLHVLIFTLYTPPPSSYMLDKT